jgi:hypothetical protein
MLNYFVTVPSKVKLIAGFEVLTAVSMKMAVFWVVAPCSLVEVYTTFQRALLPPSSGR